MANLQNIAGLLGISRRLEILPRSVVALNGAEYGIGREDGVLRFAALGPAQALTGFEGATSQYEGQTLLVGPLSTANLDRLRGLFPWLKPHPLGLQTSAGMGDRLGLATPGHVRAMRTCGGGVAPIFPQQSIREMTRTGRSPRQVMDDATWGVFAEGWQDGFGADADHLKVPEDIDRCVAVGFTFFTIDPGEHVDNAAQTMPPGDLEAAFNGLPWDRLEDRTSDLRARYLHKIIDLDGLALTFDEHSLLQAAVKYGRVIAHVLMMYRHLKAAANGKPFELEISVDETEQPTSHAEHVYIAAELRRLGVEWVSLAPRFIGRFEKGVDYIGDLGAFEQDFALHAAIARAYGPYKLSLHSGSDKFSIYPLAVKHTRGVVHLKTAGTSYLEALRTIADIDRAFFEEIYEFARTRYETDRASYHVSAELARAPALSAVKDLTSLLDQFDARQILHVTFGSVLKAQDNTGKFVFYDRLMDLLRGNADLYAQNLEKHFCRHLEAFASGATPGSAR